MKSKEEIEKYKMELEQKRRKAKDDGKEILEEIYMNYILLLEWVME